MKYLLLGVLLATTMVTSISAEDRRNFSIEDVIRGFENGDLLYFELMLQNGNYISGFNNCVDSKPAAAEWMRQHCIKNSEFKNGFFCVEDSQTMHVWFIYENAERCEQVRRPMIDRMSATRSP
jgi:hypothetical protein